MAGSSHSWEHIEELFHGACDLDAAAWTAYLAAECSDDPELRSQVEALLENAPLLRLTIDEERSR